MKKSVLFLVQNLPVPQDRRVWMEAMALRNAGFEVSVISPRNKDQSKCSVIDGISVFRYLKPPKSEGYFSYLYEYSYSLANIMVLAMKIYFKRGFSVIHSANPPDFLFLIALVFKPFGVKFIYDQHDLMPEMLLARFKKSKRHFLYKALLHLEKMSYKTADAHIATCQSGLDKALSRTKDRKKSFIVRSVPDKNVIGKKLVDQALAKVAKNKFKYLCSYIGVIGPQDGVDKLLSSIRIIVNDFGRKDIGFVLMGDGDDFDRLRKMAKKFGIESNVIFTGWADAKIISTYLYSSQVGLMPEPRNDYTNNSLHKKVLEYMYAGLPLVAYELKEAKKSAGDAAIFVKNNDELKFAKAVLRLIDDPGLRMVMGKRGKERVEINFREETSRAELLAAYEHIFNDPKRVICEAK
jgi:glycosyltransferase involved in cell wall biosynthesis